MLPPTYFLGTLWALYMPEAGGPHCADIITEIVVPTYCKVNLSLIVGDRTMQIVCATISHAELSLHWSVIHYQMDFG